MNMREKIARAICKANGDDWDREGPEGLMQAYGQVADIVLDALMEPTEWMKLAGSVASESTTDEVRPSTAAKIFSAMIEAVRNGA